MTMIKCAECGKDFSDQAKGCVHCGAPVPKKKYGWGTALIASFVVIACISGQDKSSTTSPKLFNDMDALALCQTVLKKVSKDPEKAEVPYVKNQGFGDKARFVWGAETKMARMRNGFGLEVATTASCDVTLSTQQITSLTLNGAALK